MENKPPMFEYSSAELLKEIDNTYDKIEDLQLDTKDVKEKIGFLGRALHLLKRNPEIVGLRDKIEQLEKDCGDLIQKMKEVEKKEEEISRRRRRKGRLAPPFVTPANLNEKDIGELVQEKRTNKEGVERREIYGLDTEDKIVEKVSVLDVAIEDLAKLVTSEINEPEVLYLERVRQSVYGILARLYNIIYDSRLREGSFKEKTVSFISEKMNSLLSIKYGGGELVGYVFSDVFSEFSDFIDEYLVETLITGHKTRQVGFGVERLSQGVYDRTPEEVEGIKEKNRIKVSEKIIELSKSDKLLLSDLEELHSLNNFSIVPKTESKMRGVQGSVESYEEDILMTFKKRLGTFSEDVKIEMEFLVEHINSLAQRRARKEIGRRVYGVEAAKLHNAMLSIHPFSDRNGSTCVLLLEYLMAKDGYTPPAYRIKDYYKNISQIFGGNMVAEHTISYHHKKISRQWGYYADRSMSEEKSQQYQRILEIMRDRRDQSWGEIKRSSLSVP